MVHQKNITNIKKITGKTGRFSSVALNNHYKNKDMKNSIVKIIARNAIVASIYFLLTFICSGFSFGPIQVRIAEALVLLCFFRRDFMIGITIGCFLSNLFSPILPWDLLIGTLATLLSCFIVSICKHLLISTIFPVLINGFAIGFELFFLTDVNLWVTIALVSLGEFVSVCILGYLLILLLRKNEYFLSTIGANRNQNFKF